MTRLSVNLNKIALLRNSRGRDYPNVVDYAQRFIALGAHGITVHPRQDERHSKRQDAYALGALCREYPSVEFNIEGYPSHDFLYMVEEIQPDQCTLVPDDVNQLTSDHGWDIPDSRDLLTRSLQRLHACRVRSSVFLDPDLRQVEAAADIGVRRIELYTEAYANACGSAHKNTVLADYRAAAECAVERGLGVNAGHDLNLDNLADFLQVGNISEVSIGHALTIECIDQGMAKVVARYLEICA